MPCKYCVREKRRLGVVWLEMLGFAALSQTYGACGTYSAPPPSPLSFWYDQPPILKSHSENHQATDTYRRGRSGQVVEQHLHARDREVEQWQLAQDLVAQHQGQQQAADGDPRRPLRQLASQHNASGACAAATRPVSTGRLGYENSRIREKSDALRGREKSDLRLPRRDALSERSSGRSPGTRIGPLSTCRPCAH